MAWETIEESKDITVIQNFSGSLGALQLANQSEITDPLGPSLTLLRLTSQSNLLVLS